MVNPSYMHCLNPVPLIDLWDPTKYPEDQTKKKQVILLPGQKWVFDLPPGWTVKKITYYSEIPDYDRFARIIPFSIWAVLIHGGVAFKDYLSPWLNKFYGDGITNEYVSETRGSLRLKVLIHENLGKAKLQHDHAWD